MDKSLSRILTQFVRSTDFGVPSWHHDTLVLRESRRRRFSAVP